MSAETAWLPAGAFGITPNFWMNLQMMHDLVAQRPDREVPPLREAS